ncbi:cyclase [Leptolyngbya sp. FACHB-36]|uniref:SRPBCC family protein n=1 Tax=Leptolyngbya sp. FACHB-36 TaxID=2692808 RepID=UPI0016810588|nr:SRPBCC family protein [Leptolyngbya sp. FACHB-36]MBD2019640.1 cyclase [Leptolyngbya sp. FACHB-36]
MTAFFSPNRLHPSSSQLVWSDAAALQRGEILLETLPHTAWGAAVTARMYLPLKRAIVWQHVINYPRWVQYFPAISCSEVLSAETATDATSSKRLYQVGSKNFLFFTAHVDIYLNVVETAQQRVQFRFESGSFNDFAADLRLQDCDDGTLLTYFVQATPTIPVPSLFIQQAIQLDLPSNMRTMRTVMCQS